LDISIIAVNQAPHLVSVVSKERFVTVAWWLLTITITSQKRQSGGIGGAPSDEKQRSIREFFG
jgi:hypothetical protein